MQVETSHVFETRKKYAHENATNPLIAHKASGTIGFVALLGGLIGTTTGCALGVFDLWYHATALHPRDTLMAMAFGGVPGFVAGTVLTLLFVLLQRWSPWRLDIAQWTALQTGVALLAFTAAFILFITHNLRDWRGFGIMLVSLLPAVILGIWVSSQSFARRPWHTVSGCLWIMCGLLVVSCSAVTAREYGAGRASILVAVVTATIFAWIGKRSIGRLLPSGAMLVLTGLLACGFSVYGSPSIIVPEIVRSNAQPNVVLIVLDTTRRDYLGCYGHKGGLTPMLDRMATESVVYEDCYSTSSWTVPSHATMFTGQYPMTHGCTYATHLWLDDDSNTMAELLRKQGYDTAAFYSNFYLGACNLLAGFDTRTKVGGRYHDLAFKSVAEFLGLPNRWCDKGASVAVGELEKWLSNRGTAAKPAFIFINLLETHAPYLPPLQERLNNLPDGMGFLNATHTISTSENRALKLHIEHQSDPDYEAVSKALYAGGVQYQDRQLGQIFDRLRRLTDFDNTLLIITSDHGENLGDEGRWEHSCGINDDLLKLPLIIRYPRKNSGGSRLDGWCQNVDFLPTVFDVMGVNTPAGLQGQSVKPGRFKPREAVYAQASPFYEAFPFIEKTLGFESGLSEFNSRLRVIRSGDMKFIWSSHGRHQLFNLASDPEETRNLVATQPDSAMRLQKQLLDWWAAQPEYVQKQPSKSHRPVEDATLRGLKKLGYIN